MDLIRAQFESCEAFDSGNVRGAVAVLDKIDESKLTGQLFYNLFIFHSKLGETKRAMGALDRCLKRDANHALCHFQLGMIQYSCDDFNGK